MQLGGNDICSNSCGGFADTGDASPQAYKRNIGQMLHVLSNLPKTLVLLLALPDLSQWDSIPNKSHLCDLSLRTQCSCLYQGQVEEIECLLYSFY